MCIKRLHPLSTRHNRFLPWGILSRHNGRFRVWLTRSPNPRIQIQQLITHSSARAMTRDDLLPHLTLGFLMSSLHGKLHGSCKHTVALSAQRFGVGRVGAPRVGTKGKGGALQGMPQPLKLILQRALRLWVYSALLPLAPAQQNAHFALSSLSYLG